MGALFGGGSKLPSPPPLPPAPPPPPTEVSGEVVKSKLRIRNRARLAQGRTSTILTSPQGLPSLADKSKKTLLGV